MKIAVIGAGMTGVSCARALVDAGLAPVMVAVWVGGWRRGGLKGCASIMVRSL